jgi:hypothetical protein
VIGGYSKLTENVEFKEDSIPFLEKIPTNEKAIKRILSTR